VTGTLTANPNGTYVDNTLTKGTEQLALPASCLLIAGTTVTCDRIDVAIAALGFAQVTCANAPSGGGCTCAATVAQSGWPGLVSFEASTSGSYVASGNLITLDARAKYAYCVSGNRLTSTPQSLDGTTVLAGTIVLQNGSAGSGGSGGGAAGSGGRTGAGGAAGTGGRTGSGGASAPDAAAGSGGGPATGGRTGSGGATSSGGTTGSGGTTSPGTGGSTGTRGPGPCDVYAAASPATPCVAAYSMIRALSSTYNGPLYQVRKDSSSKNTGTGGTTTDIGMLPDGFADSAAQDAFCTGSTCTVAKLYDQSGSNNHLVVEKKGTYTSGGGQAAQDDWETLATRKKLKVGGHDVYALFMNTHEGYRFNESTTIPATKGANQGIYMLTDGTGTGADPKTSAWGGFCCWDFGTAARDNSYEAGTGSMNALFFGQYIAWGKGAEKPPWFMADFEAGIWAGGSGAANEVITANPTMAGVNYAFGILKNDTKKYSIQVGNGQSGNLTKVNDANLPFSTWKVGGGIILGTGGDNSNWGWGTFYEGAITNGRPTDDADGAVLKNVQEAKYGQ
jgi:hypothetical protein